MTTPELLPGIPAPGFANEPALAERNLARAHAERATELAGTTPGAAIVHAINGLTHAVLTLAATVDGEGYPPVAEFLDELLDTGGQTVDVDPV